MNQTTSSVVTSRARLVAYFAVGALVAAMLAYYGAGSLPTAGASSTGDRNAEEFAIAARPEERPLKGPIPDRAPIGDVNRIAKDIPQFIPALTRDGDVAGFVSYEAHLAPGNKPIPVFDESLKRVVGQMVPGYGFVPNGQPLSEAEPFRTSDAIGR